MILPTVCIACMPGYADIGIYAPALLVGFRFLQGFCMGGEYGNNIVYLSELAKKDRVFFFGSIGCCAGAAGIFLASIVTTLCSYIASPQLLLDYVWRIPFLISAVVGILTLHMRQKMSETKVFDWMKAEHLILVNPIKHAFRQQSRDFIITFCITLFPATLFYFSFFFFLNILIYISMLMCIIYK